MFILNKSPYPLGLDISDLSLKLVQLNKIGDKIKIQAIGKIELAPGLIKNGEIKNKEEVIRAINKLVASPNIGKVSSDEVAACLPEEKTFIKLVEIKEDLNNIDERIGVEIEKHIPLPIDRIYYDWQIIEDLPKRKLILIGAAPKDLVDQYTEVLRRAKLSVVALESEPISICRSLLAEEHFKYRGKHEKNYGLIDIGATNACLIVYSKKTILFTASMPISGEEITNQIALDLKIGRDRAEKAKIDYSLGRENSHVETILYKMTDELINKNSKAIRFYNSHFSNWGPIEKIILCGGGANIKNLDKLIQKNTGIETTTADVLINLNDKRKKILKFFGKIEAKKPKKEKAEIKKSAQNKSLAFATAIGLALRGIFISDH